MSSGVDDVFVAGSLMSSGINLVTVACKFCIFADACVQVIAIITLQLCQMLVLQESLFEMSSLQKRKVQLL